MNHDGWIRHSQRTYISGYQLLLAAWVVSQKHRVGHNVMQDAALAGPVLSQSSRARFIFLCKQVPRLCFCQHLLLGGKMRRDNFEKAQVPQLTGKAAGDWGLVFYVCFCPVLAPKGFGWHTTGHCPPTSSEVGCAERHRPAQAHLETFHG